MLGDDAIGFKDAFKTRVSSLLETVSLQSSP